MTNTGLSSPLAEPLVLPGGTRLRNRVVHASMSTFMSDDSHVTDRLIRYFANRAQGGAGAVVTEPLSMARHQRVWDRVRVWNDDNLDGLTRWAQAVDRYDSRLFGQIQDPGRARHESGRSFNAIGPSRLADDLSWSMPRELSAGEIRELIDDFAASSARLHRCGFAGVEFSAGHGHLFHQFLSPQSNVRTDEFGGDWNGRTRFLRELIEAIRAQCPRHFAIGLKLPGDDGVPGGIGPDEAALVTSMLTRSGDVDYVCFAQGSHARSLEMHVPDRFGERVPYAGLIRRLRESANGVPVMALGRITDPAEAEAILERGEAELIGLGRTLVADPAWLDKALAGRAHDIRYCVSCNTCWDTIITYNRPIACINNPRVAEADEVDFKPPRAPEKKRVAVVGAGVAGLEAAWVAAARGHDVTVFGASREPGGKAHLRSHLPGGETITSVYDYQFVAAQRAGARFELGRRAGIDDIREFRPDEVILATGATHSVPSWVPAEYAESGLIPDINTAMAELLRHPSRQPGSAVIFDMDQGEGTYAAAEMLATVFERVAIITPRESIAQEVSLVTRQGFLRRLALARVRVLTLCEPVIGEAFETEGRLEYRNVYSGEAGFIDDIAFLAYATPRVPDISLLGPLQRHGIPTRLVGDCRTGRGILAATADGHEAGNAV
ncbi:NADH:flavin oxidoreductase [Caballeronia temeraria]|uniref:NADH:flavin oxidoreductase n=1 Tax=Caballeronia temeraria TaxID=1777137 RepID=A0A158A136_9BURK|nr:NAD(P)-binding protein [Caballeronia temeraria]SAK51475.1 NADH:flavin oxidoreductase [Caballeronia temeraria]